MSFIKAKMTSVKPRAQDSPGGSTSPGNSPAGWREGKVSGAEFAALDHRMQRRGSTDDSELRELSSLFARSPTLERAGSRDGSPNSWGSDKSPSPQASPNLRERSFMARKRHNSFSGATTILRFKEWAAEADPAGRRRGRLVVQSERNLDFITRQHERQARFGEAEKEDGAWAVRVLREHFLFSHTPEATLALLVDAMEPLRFEADEHVFSAGDGDDQLYLVVAGELVQHTAGSPVPCRPKAGLAPPTM